jgi:hypothetical protein
VLDALQRGLERLYRIDTQVSVRDFVIDAEARDEVNLARTAREQLLIAEIDGAVEIGLFVDEGALANLSRNDPSRSLHDGNIGDFLLAVEGVSHFVYTVWRARSDRQVSALELELQAEIDKYVTCLLIGPKADRAGSSKLRRKLFEQFELEPDLDAAERDRYRAATANASRYSASLEKRYVAERRIGDMLRELRRVYRMSLSAKLDFISQAA